jgi:hypothetical protein
VDGKYCKHGIKNLKIKVTVPYLVQLDENSVVDLSQTEELKRLSDLRMNLIDTENLQRPEFNFRLRTPQ